MSDSKPVPPLNFHQNDQRYERLFLALGRATMYWAGVERNLAVWLARISKIDDPAANDIFFSANSFRGRLDILKAAAIHSTMSAAQRELFDAVAQKASLWTNFRNRFVHGTALEARRILGGERVQMIVDGYGPIDQAKLAGGITSEKLERAASNFFSLTEILLDGEGAINSRKRKQLPALLARVEQLPNEPESSELSLKQQARERQRQAAARKNARPKNSGKAG
jgi:hypothetical protein